MPKKHGQVGVKKPKKKKKKPHQQSKEGTAATSGNLHGQVVL